MKIKRLLLCFLALLQIFSLGAWALERDMPISGSAGKGLLWRIRGNRLVISGTGAMEHYESGKAPWYEARDTITTIAIGGGVTDLGEHGFDGLSGVTRIIFLGNCPQIAENAFSGITAQANYGESQEGWNQETIRDYGGTLTWSCPCDHVYTQSVTASTCTERGFTTHLCKKCGESYVDSYREPLGHELTGWRNQGGYQAEIRSVCHRGSNLAPENTLAAYEVAKKQGYVYVETDVQFTKDGVPVLIHDSTVDRTSNGTGKVSDFTYEELKKLDFGSWVSDRYAGTIIPTFEEFLQLCSQLGLKPYVELKTGIEAEKVPELVKLIQRYGMEQDVTFISFDYQLLEAAGQQLPGVRLGYLVTALGESQISLAQGLKQYGGAVFLDCSYGALTADGIQRAKDQEIPLEVWTVDDENWISGMDSYISGITSDSTGILAAAAGEERHCLWCEYEETRN